MPKTIQSRLPQRWDRTGRHGETHENHSALAIFDANLNEARQRAADAPQRVFFKNIFFFYIFYFTRTENAKRSYLQRVVALKNPLPSLAVSIRRRGAAGTSRLDVGRPQAADRLAGGRCSSARFSRVRRSGENTRWRGRDAGAPPKPVLAGRTRLRGRTRAAAKAFVPLDAGHPRATIARVSKSRRGGVSYPRPRRPVTRDPV